MLTLVLSIAGAVVALCIGCAVWGWRKTWREASVVVSAGRHFRPEEGGAPDGAESARAPVAGRTLRVYFIKPSKYHHDGYVLQFWKGVLPNNTLTVLSALNEAYNRLRAEDNVYLETVLWDEIVDGPLSAGAIRAIREKADEDGVEAIVGIAGAQTNQYPRGRDLALQFVAAGFPVVFGGFHDLSHWDAMPPLTREGFRQAVGAATEEEARRALAFANLEGVLGYVRCPVLVVHGKRDAIIPWHQAERIAQELPAGATLLLDEDGVHCCHNHAIQYRAAMADWLAKTLRVEA